MINLLIYLHAAISAATSKKLGLHLQYLSEDLVGLLFLIQEHSPRLSCKEITSKIYAFLGNRGLDRLFTTKSQMFRHHGLNQLLEIMVSNHPSKWTVYPCIHSFSH